MELKGFENFAQAIANLGESFNVASGVFGGIVRSLYSEIDFQGNRHAFVREVLQEPEFWERGEDIERARLEVPEIVNLRVTYFPFINYQGLEVPGQGTLELDYEFREIGEWL